MAIQELTRTVAVLKALEDLVKAQLAEIKLDTIDELGEMGVERMQATLPDGRLVAHVTRVAPVDKLTVLHDEDVIAWAKENAPHLVEHVPERTEVIPAHDRLIIGGEEELLKTVEDTGEAIPGIGIKKTNPYIKVSYAAGGRQAIAEGLRQAWLVDGVVQRLLTTGREED